MGIDVCFLSLQAPKACWFCDHYHLSFSDVQDWNEKKEKHLTIQLSLKTEIFKIKRPENKSAK